jgi:hypothetical protein
MDKAVQAQFSSIKLDQLVYVELESRNGGMMLTVSEEGFTFRAVTSVRPSGRISFSFVINGNEKLQGFGEIKWTKDEGKVAGLQFTDISSEFLDALRKWLAQLSARAVSSPDETRTDTPFDPDHNSSAESPQSPPPEQLVETSTKPVFGLNFGQSLHGGMPRHEVPPPSYRETSASQWPRSTPVLSEWKYPDGLQPDARPRGSGLVTAAVVACLLLLAVLLYSFRESIGRSLISLGQQLSAPSETSQAQGPDTPKPTAEGVQQSTPANSGTPQAPTNPDKENPDKENNAASASPSPPATTSSDKSEPARPPSVREKAVSPPAKQQSQFRDERPASPAEEGAPQNTRNLDAAEEVRALWSAVSQGDTSAEVTLAKLYMIGRGVKKNCDQARVLLRVAAKKGNPEAIAKLSQITRQGCP